MNNKIFTRRSLVFLSICLLLFFGLTTTLYSAQIVHGNEYVEESSRKQSEIQMVDVSRGAILDRYGRVLVSDQVSYRVVLDLEKLGEDEKRENTLNQLFTWSDNLLIPSSDSLNISRTFPFEYTVENVFYGTYQNEEGEDYRVLSRLGRLSVAMEWIEDPTEEDVHLPSAQELLMQMAESFGLVGRDLERQRSMAGMIYELYLRKYNILYDEVVFAEDVPIDLTVRLKEYGLVGVEVEAVTERIYGTEYAAHLLGRVASMNETEWEYYKTVGYDVNEMVGKEGAEYAFESYLRGNAGIREVERNNDGEIMSANWVEEPVPGRNVVLTLDIDLQKKVEDVLAEQIPQMAMTQIEGAAAVLMEVDSGAVLAAGSYPTFNLALYGEEYNQNVENPLNPLFNRAFQGTYAPGSTFKMVTGIAALEEGVATTRTTICCDGTYNFYEEHGPACWIYNQFRGSHSYQNISDAIKNSCNYYFYEVGRELGIQRISEYASMFGLGESTGIELPERQGVMAGPSYTESVGGTWYDGATLSVAIGQESSVFTPLQLTRYIATLVNGGTGYEAHLLHEIKSGDFSQVVHSYSPEENAEHLNLEQANVDAVKQGMRDLINSGSVQAEFAYLTSLGITVGAKTGTAQLTSEASASANAVFVCFAPYENPEVALTVVVEKGGSGSEAAIVAAEILEYYFTNKENRDEISRENSLIP